MEARAKSAGKTPALNPRLALFFLAAGAILLAGVGAFALLRPESRGAAGPAPTRAAYIEFGPVSDTLWLAPPDNPSGRKKTFVAQHATSYGIVAALSPDGQSLAYGSLAPDTTTPSPDSPADLYLASLKKGQPRRLNQGIDLLVRPLWTPDSRSVIVRRTDAKEQATFRLLAIDVSSGQERPLVSSSAALFPAGFSPGDGAFYFVEVMPGASELRMLAPDGSTIKSAGHLSDDLTRDWTLSPDGARLAFLALSVAGERVTSRAMVLDLASGRVMPAAEPEGDQFGPAWSPRGALSIGEVAADAATPAPARTNGQPTLPGPEMGFDVPAGWSPDGRYLAVRTFQGNSAATPGSSALAVVGPNGFRTTLASQEVTFLGWVSH